MAQTFYGWMTSLWLVLLVVLFIGIIAWAFRPKNKARFERDAKIPLQDDDRGK